MRTDPPLESLTVQRTNVRTASLTTMHGHQSPPDPGLFSLSQGSYTPGDVAGTG
ncbi:hypothetical protein DPMN_023739 [Dreissena polymorpha]|uniref:Uncharacterized protein n=1 Tax=Dreissena polymorpha TaxID=45954 RepID=A0A9D4LMN8_DREPO|nr:hypothetical protein DPMN_023739 [Dreissena polymorpha]